MTRTRALPLLLLGLLAIGMAIGWVRCRLTQHAEPAPADPFTPEQRAEIQRHFWAAVQKIEVKPWPKADPATASFQRHMRAAQQKHEAKDWPGEVADLAAALKSIPNHPLALRRLAWLTLQRGNAPMAKKLGAQAFAASVTPQQRALALANLGRIAEAENAPMAAIDLYQRSQREWRTQSVQRRLEELTLPCASQPWPEKEKELLACLCRTPIEQLMAPYAWLPSVATNPPGKGWSCKTVQYEQPDYRKYFVLELRSSLLIELRTTDAEHDSVPVHYFGISPDGAVEKHHIRINGHPPTPPTLSAEQLAEFQRHVGAAQQKQGASDWPSAFSELEAALEVSPDDLRVLADLGYAAKQLGCQIEANELWRLAFTFNSSEGPEAAAIHKYIVNFAGRQHHPAHPCSEPRPLSEVCRCLRETDFHQFYNSDSTPLALQDRYPEHERSCELVAGKELAGARLFRIRYDGGNANRAAQYVVAADTGAGWAAFASLGGEGCCGYHRSLTFELHSFKEKLLGSARILWAEFSTREVFEKRDERSVNEERTVMLCTLSGAPGTPRCPRKPLTLASTTEDGWVEDPNRTVTTETHAIELSPDGTVTLIPTDKNGKRDRLKARKYQIGDL